MHSLRNFLWMQTHGFRKKNRLEKTGGGLRDKEEMVIHATNKLAVNVTVNETEKSCPFDATSAKGCMSLRLLCHIGKNLNFAASRQWD